MIVVAVPGVVTSQPGWGWVRHVLSDTVRGADDEALPGGYRGRTRLEPGYGLDAQSHYRLELPAGLSNSRCRL